MKNDTIFERAAEQYESIKPINGSVTPKSLDIRPWSDRKRKYERVAKHNDDTYLMTDSNHTWLLLRQEEEWPTWVKQGSISHESLRGDDLLMAPVVVSRDYEHGEPYTTIRVRIPTRYSLSSTLRVFISDVLSHISGGRMDFDRIAKGSGEYAVYVRESTNVDPRPYILPKSLRLAPEWMILASRSSGGKNNVSSDEDYSYLLFREKDGQIVLDERSPKFSRMVRRVNKEVKDKYRPKIKAFVEHAVSVAPLLNPEEYGNHTLYTLLGVRDSQVAECVRAIISDEDHKDRMLFAGWLLAHTDYYMHTERVHGYYKKKFTLLEERNEHGGRKYDYVPVWVEPYTVPEQKRAAAAVRNKINALINKHCDFTHLVAKEEV